MYELLAWMATGCEDRAEERTCRDMVSIISDASTLTLLDERKARSLSGHGEFDLRLTCV